MNRLINKEENINYDKNSVEVFETMLKPENSLYIISGKIGTGKSVFLMAYLNYIKRFHKNKYKEKIIVSSTIFNGFFSKNGIPNVEQHETITIEQIEILKEMQKKQPENKRKPILLVLDDVFANNGINLRSKGVEQLISVLRHYKISVIFVLQQIHMVGPKIRCNAHGYILFDTIGSDNIKSIYQCLSTGDNLKEFTSNFLLKLKDHGGLFVNNLKNSLDEGRMISFKINPVKFGVKV